MPINMPSRNTQAEVIARAASKCLLLECRKHFNIVRVGDVCEIVSGGTPDTHNPFYWDGEIIWITPKDLGRPRSVEIFSSERKITETGLNNSSARLLPVGTVLLSSRAPIGHLGISEVPLATNQGFKNIICGDAIYNRFLFYMLRAMIDELQSMGRGNTFMEIPASVVKEVLIPLPPIPVQQQIAHFLDTFYLGLESKAVELLPLPAPLDGQRRIVAQIEALAARIEDARGLRRSAVEEAEALLKSARRDAFISLRGSKIVPLEKTCGVIIDNLHSNPVYDDDGLYPCIRSSDVGRGKLFLETARRTNEAEYKRRTVRGEPTADDIVLVREGGGTGKAAIVEDGQKFSLGQRVMMLRPDNKIVLPRFLLNQILSPLIYEDQIVMRTKGSASPHLNISILRKFDFILPPLPEQYRIVAYLDGLQAEVDTLKRLQAETAAELDAMLPSVLDKAFKGEL